MSTTHSTRRASGWVGWIWFAALVMAMNGTFNILDGLVALLKHRVYVQSENGLIVFNYTAWGWILLIIGVVQVVVAVALMTSGAFWARIVAIFMVMVSAISQVAFITAYPFWSITVILLNVVVLWALVVHGEEAEAGARY